METEQARTIADAREREKINAIAAKLREEGAEDAAVRSARDQAVRECAPLSAFRLPFLSRFAQSPHTLLSSPLHIAAIQALF